MREVFEISLEPAKATRVGARRRRDVGDRLSVHSDRVRVPELLKLVKVGNVADSVPHRRAKIKLPLCGLFPPRWSLGNSAAYSGRITRGWLVRACADEEQPRSILRNPEIRGVQHLVGPQHAVVG